MKSIILLVLSLSIFTVNAGPISKNNNGIEWPVYLDNKDNQYYFNLSIGTPEQTVPVSLYYFHNYADLQIVSQSMRGDYNENASSTWSPFFETGYIDLYGNNVGQWGEESFMIGDKSFSKIPFALQQVFIARSFSSLGFGRSIEESSPGFWSTFFKQLGSEKQILTVAFDNYPSNGVITAGSLDTKRCNNDWQFFKQEVYRAPEQEFGFTNRTHFGVSIDRISIGKYTFAKLGKIRFQLNDRDIVWPQKIYKVLLKALGSLDGTSVPCNTNVTVDIKLQDDFIFQIQPKDYLVHYDKDFCVVYGVPPAFLSDEITLPRSFFKDYCVSLNHKEQEIGFATVKH